jgi:hypothetical protein
MVTICRVKESGADHRPQITRSHLDKGSASVVARGPLSPDRWTIQAAAAGPYHNHVACCPALIEKSCEY